MTMTPKHARSPRRARQLLAGAGLVLTGATLAAVGSAVIPAVAGAAESKSASVNYVKSANPDAVSGVLLDEDVAVQFNAPVLASSVGPDTILVRTGQNNGEQARGRYVVGAFMYDRATQRRAVIKPEAIREYYQLVKGLPREDADRAAKSFLKRLEATGRLSMLKEIDQKLKIALGPNYGSRLDDEITPIYAIFPSQVSDLTDNKPDGVQPEPPQELNDNDDPLTLDPGDDPREPYRTRIAGDDALWEAYLAAGDINAYGELSQNSEYERFYHPVDGATGVPSATSVLRQREFRRVLIDRRSSKRVMFVPEIPIRADLADTGYTPGRAYSVIVPASQPGVYNTVLTKDGRALVQKGGRDFSTLFTTVPSTTTNLFRDGEARTGVTTLQKPRVINQTPPNAEAYVDPTTDWEDPDNQFTVPIPARRTFTIRVRFAQPLDPRTISPTTFTVTKKASIDAAGNETAVNVPVAVGTFLNQHRLGIVEVEITPATNLDPLSKYEVVVRNLVRSLGGATNPTDYSTTFIVGPGAAPLDAIRESFTNTQNRADPTSPSTSGQITTAYWPAPALYDTTSSGKLVGSFMQFAGTGVGAPADPRVPTSPIVTDLDLGAGGAILFVTEQVDPANPQTLGTQIEYNYRSVKMNFAIATASGRYPLVIRSQSSISLVGSQINVAGQPGGDGHANSDTVNGGPVGGLGGRPGSGGYAGGDGACSPLTGADGAPITDNNGNLQFDQAKFNGSDGFPSYLFTGAGTGGAGSGGFSGDREAANNVDCAGTSAIDKDDAPCTPARVRESGGGGGHATAGGAGAGARISTRTHPGGYYGGLGGTTYGRSDFGDQPKNGLFGTIGVPRLGYGSGGAGGGGGGAEDSGGASNAPDGVANAADSGGGGGGGGGGAVQLVARTVITVDSTVIDASGGRGGQTRNASNSDYGYGAPGGCGAGGAIWLQCYGDIVIENGSTLTAAGGDNTTSIGYITVKPDNANPLNASPATGRGGVGGDGYVRFEDSDGAADIKDPLTSLVKGVLTEADFKPYDNPITSAVEAEFQAFPGTPFVVNFSQGFSRWTNTQLDTPSFAPHYDDLGTVEVDGTSFTAPAGSVVDIWVRSAPNDTANSGSPNLNLATSWTRYDDVGTISRRRFVQYRVDFTIPLSYDFNIANLPSVDFLRIDVNLN